MNKTMAWLLVVLAGAASADPAPESHPAEAVVRALTRSIDDFDLEGFAGSFSEDVTMFYPLAALAPRVDGREALAATQRRVFESLGAQLRAAGKTAPPYFGLEPSAVRVQPLGDEAAVVTWHVDRGSHLGRRTAVVQKRDGAWKIVSYHASNVETPRQPGPAAGNAGSASGEAREDALSEAAEAVAEGDLGAGLGRLEELFAAHYPTPSRVLADPRFAPLREDAESRAAWRRLLRQHVRESRITMVTPAEAGAPMLVRGRVVSSPGSAAIAGAVLELYHTDATGRYEPGDSIGEDSRARLFGFVRSDEEGRFEVRTIKPAPYPGASEGAAHVHFRISAEGYRSYGADFRPYDHPATPAERASALEQAWRVSTVHQEGDLLICEVTIPMRPQTREP